MTTVVQAASSVVAAYLLGSFPSGLLLVHLTRGRDIRNWYSGRTGGTNVMRVAGIWAGLGTAALDVLKAFLAVRFARWISGGSAWLEVVSGAMAIIGHNYSLFLMRREDGRLKFRGGAGGASAFGATLGIWPQAGPIILLLALLILFGIGYASVATMSVPLLAGAVFAIRAAAGLQSWVYVVYGILAEIIVVLALLPNIKRLIAGEERLVGWRAKRRTSITEEEHSSSEIEGQGPASG
jgi:glycerol-3-phosphate acyltransferase PlsY